MADQLANADELRAFLGVSETELSTDRADSVLSSATALVQATCRQRLVAVDDDQVELTLPHGPGHMLTRRVELPERPVRAVSLVQTMDYGAASEWFTQDATSWQLVNNSVWREIPWRYHRMRVTYDHGFNEVPQDLKWAVMSVASRNVVNSQGVRSETIGSYSYTLGNDQVSGSLNSGEREVCMRYRQRTYAMRE